MRSLVVKGIGGIFKSVAHYEFPQKTVADFDARPPADQILSDWNESDDEWLDGGKVDQVTKPAVNAKPSTALSSPVGRVRLCALLPMPIVAGRVDDSKNRD